MKALVYLGPNKKSLEDRPMPVIAAPTDAIVKLTRTTICGTDLHILKGDVPSCTPGRRQMDSHCTTGGWIRATASTARRPSSFASRMRT